MRGALALDDGERLARIEATVEAILDQTKRTNGRVTALEAWRIDMEARDDERRRLGKEAARRAADQAARRAWIPPAVVAVACTVLAQVLAVAAYLLFLD